MRAAASAIAVPLRRACAAVASARVLPVPAFNHLNLISTRRRLANDSRRAMPARRRRFRGGRRRRASARAADAARVAAERMHLDFNHQSGYKYLQQRRKAQGAGKRGPGNIPRHQRAPSPAVLCCDPRGRADFLPAVRPHGGCTPAVDCRRSAGRSDPACHRPTPTPPVVQPANPTPAVVSSGAAPVDPPPQAAPSRATPDPGAAV